jgi:hypothetical protein
MQNPGDRDIILAQGLSIPATVPTDTRVTVVHARHQNAARRRANRGSSVELGEPQPFARHLIEAWCLDDFLSVAPQLGVPQVVSENKNQIGFSICGANHQRRKYRRAEQRLPPCT